MQSWRKSHHRLSKHLCVHNAAGVAVGRERDKRLHSKPGAQLCAVLNREPAGTLLRRRTLQIFHTRRRAVLSCNDPTPCRPYNTGYQDRIKAVLTSSLSPLLKQATSASAGFVNRTQCQQDTEAAASPAVLGKSGGLSSRSRSASASLSELEGAAT